MENELKILLEETLKVHEKIKFDLTYVTKGCIVELEIGNRRNGDCGDIYSQLSGWLGYNEFIEYLMTKGVVHNFKGEICIENTEIVIYLILKDLTYDFDDEETYIYFDEEFITNELKINLSEIGMDDFDEENFCVNFYQIKGNPIQQLEFNYYSDDWHPFNLENNQLKILVDFIESRLEKVKPVYDVDFECDTEWEVDCVENCLSFDVCSTPIRLELNEIDSK
jgi:hypothetical protein